MNKYKIVNVIRTSLNPTKPNLSPIFFNRYSKDESGKTDMRLVEHEKKKAKSKEILNKLNTLLKGMAEQSQFPSKTPKLELSKPKPKDEKKSSKEAEDAPEDPKEKVMKAVQDVAESLGGNTKQTESELMKKLLNNNENSADTISSLSDLFKGMKIDRSQPIVEQQSRSEQVKNILSYAQKQQKKSYSGERVRPRTQNEMKKRSQALKLDNINLFGKKPLGIFNCELSEYSEGVHNATWEKLKLREMKLAITHPPSNYFQEQILWTEQGKLWKFPIDNEQGWEEEKNVDFSEHIFLEKHLEPWCPSKGPIRHFMELVCVGLSKNSYLKVEAKVEHIEWYRKYFDEKKQVLEEVGLGLSETKTPKQIEK